MSIAAIVSIAVLLTGPSPAFNSQEPVRPLPSIAVTDPKDVANVEGR